MIKARIPTLEDIKDVVARSKKTYEGDRDLVASIFHGWESGPTACLSFGDDPVGCIVGCIFIGTGVASCWAITTPELDKHPLAYTRYIKRLIEVQKIKHNVHRAEVTVKASYVEGIRWAKFLGFEAEGLLRQYGSDKSDHLIFGRIW